MFSAGGLDPTRNNFWCPCVDVDAFATKFFAVTLTCVLQNLIRSSAGASEYSLSVLSELFKPFTRYRGNNIWPDEQMNEQDNGTV